MTVAEIETIECAFAKNVVKIPEELTVLQDSQKLINKISFGVFRILTAKDGDKRVVWCRRILPEIAAAKKMFLDLIKNGMIPYRVGTDGKATAKEMTEFDPTAEEVIFLPMKAIRGG